MTIQGWIALLMVISGICFPPLFLLWIFLIPMPHTWVK